MKQPGFIRIIGGTWRGRRLPIATVPNLRPTPDRVRETIFNWLAPSIAGAVCLDLFAGTGAFGFEALSRGAKEAVFVDNNVTVIDTLNAQKKLLQASQAVIYRANLPDDLQTPAHPFDIVFIDPPYQSNLLMPTCFFLEAQQLLSPSAYIYLEANEEIKDNDLPPNWHIIKSKHAGNVFYHLAKRELP